MTEFCSTFNKGKVPTFKCDAMKRCKRAEVKLQTFLASVLHGVRWSALRSGRVITGVRAPGTQWTERLDEPQGWVGRGGNGKRKGTPSGNRTPNTQHVATFMRSFGPY
jgi:hypothetical protein